MAAVVPSDSTPVHASQPINIAITGADSNTTTGYDPDADPIDYPTEPAVNYYISIEKSGQTSLVSEVFSTNFDKVHTWPSVIIPASGTWTAHLRKESDDSSVANASIVAS
jgi:hypothetical protein